MTTLRDWAGQEEGRFILWAPVLMIIGIAVYFSLKVEPSAYIAATALGLSALILGRGLQGRAPRAMWIGRALFLIALGFGLAQLRTHTVASPIMPNEIVIVRIDGELLAVENRPNSQRFLIAPSKIGGMASETLPDRIRVTWRGKPSTSVPGDIVGFRGSVGPPPGPAVPGGFDYGRQLYFERIGGTGFAVSPPRTMWSPPARPWAAKVQKLRWTIAQNIMEKSSAEAGPVLAAVATGMRAQIPPETTQQLRDTGLAHLLAISGLHMGLVCGFLFVGLRTIFVMTPTLAARFPVKKWAAIGALVGGVIYLTMSGGAWSAQRAFIMAAISFFAILFDRRAISLRNVAVAAILILVLKPEAALSAGFQMSFSAVIALVATYDAWSRWRRSRPWEYQRASAPIRFLGGMLTTSFVAGLATSPFAIYHFGRIANYGLGANMAVMPLFTIGVMPIAVLGLMLMPLGLDGPLWWIAGKAFGALLWVTAHIASWPGAVTLVPQWPPGAWLMLVAGLLVTSLLLAPWRILGVLSVPIALVLAWSTPQPDIHIGDGAKNVAVADWSGGGWRVLLYNRRSERFAAGTWLESYGLSTVTRDAEIFGPCKERACLVPPYTDVYYAPTVGEVEMVCADAALIITPAWLEGVTLSCPGPVISADRLDVTGPTALYRNGNRWRMTMVMPIRGNRPWSGND